MNFKTYLFGVALIGIAMTACDRTPDVSGTWYGNMQTLSPSGENDPAGRLVNSQITPQLSFKPSSDDKKTGTVTISSEFTVQDALNLNPDIITPYEISVSGTASIQGTYSWHDDDEIYISFDNKTLKVDIDPDAVSYASNIVSGQQAPQIDSLRPNIVNAYIHRLQPRLQGYFAGFSHLDDIKVMKDKQLKIEIKDSEQIFSRQ